MSPILDSVNNVVGLDMGASALKLYTATGGLQFLSHVAHQVGPLIDQSVFGFSRRAEPIQITHDDGRYWVGQDAHTMGRPNERFDSERFSGTPELRALVYGMFSSAIRQGLDLQSPLTVVLGLPQDIGEGDRAKANADAARKWLVGAHHWTAGTTKRELQIERVIVTSQVNAAYADYIADDDGNKIAQHQFACVGDIGVISIGGGTCELVVMRDGQPVPKSARSEPIGVRTLLASAPEYGALSLGDLDIRLRKKRLDTSAYFNDWAASVTSFIRREWGRGIKHLQAVIVAGGGSILLERELRDVCGQAIQFSDERVLGIARGLRKLGVLNARAARKAA